MKNFQLTHLTPSFRRLSSSLVAPLIGLMISGCAIVQPPGRPSDPLEALRYDINGILSDSIFVPAHACIKIKSLDTKETLFERDSKMLFRPASNMKLVTSATSLHELGKDYQLNTIVLSDSPPIDGMLNGNLYVKGYGNPNLSTLDLDTLVSQVQAAGVKSVIGGVVADVAFFDSLYWGSGWNWDDEPSSYAAFLTPLAINSNSIVVSVTPGKSPGDSVIVTTDPPTSYVTIANKARTVSDSGRHRLIVTRLFMDRLNTILVDGEIAVGSNPVKRDLSVWKPELYAATLFQEALQRRGIHVAYQASIGHAPAAAVQLAIHSQILDSTIVNMDKISDNLSAEMLLKTLGAVKRATPGSSRSGVRVVHEFLNSLGIDTTKFEMVDGSGLSYHDLLTAEMIVQLLEGMAQQTAIFPTYYRSLPIAGVDGTLRNRMKQTPAEGNLHAKTGTIGGVSSLSGYVQTLDGEKLVFSMSMQNFIYPTRLYTRAQDRIGALLAGFSRSHRSATPKP